MVKDNWYLIIIAFLLLALGFSVHRWLTFKKQSKDKDSIIAEQNDSVRYHKNQFGRVVAEKLVAEASAREIAKAYPALEKELKEEFDIKIKDLKAYLRNEIVAVGAGRSSIVNHYHIDSAGNKIEYRDINFNDGYLQFKTTLFEGLDFGESTYEYRDTIVSVIHSKKNWIFGRERLYTSTSLRNPNAKSVATTNALVNNYRDKRFCVFAGVGYDPFNNKPTVSIGIGYSIVKF